VALALLRARKGAEDACRDALSSAFGLALPTAGHTASAGSMTAVWVEPGSWLIMAARAGEGELVRRLASCCGAEAAVVDQTYGKSVLHVSGECARDVLSKGCRIDLHPRVFGPRRAVTTQISHIGCTVVRADEASSFDLIVPSTFAQAFFEWLTVSAAEYGCVVHEPSA
jgi:sarcosine oxidase subunit gamma